MPTLLCHIVCGCMHAYDSCATELQKNACLFVKDNETKSDLGQAVDIFPSVLIKVISFCMCLYMWVKPAATVFVHTADSGPYIHIWHIWQRNPRARHAAVCGIPSTGGLEVFIADMSVCESERRIERVEIERCEFSAFRLLSSSPHLRDRNCGSSLGL